MDRRVLNAAPRLVDGGRLGRGSATRALADRYRGGDGDGATAMVAPVAPCADSFAIMAGFPDGDRLWGRLCAP